MRIGGLQQMRERLLCDQEAAARVDGMHQVVALERAWQESASG